MKRSVVGLVCLLGSCAVQSQNPPLRPVPSSTPINPASAPAPAPAPVLGIEVRPDADGIRVSYRLADAAPSFRFDHAGAKIRADTWRVLSAGLTFKDDDLTSAAPVSTFDLAIAPDSKQRDRIYPALTRVGAGWLFYAPHLRVESVTVPIHWSIDVPPEWTVIGRRDAKGDLVGDGYVYLGPSSLVHRGTADVVGSATTPPWLLQEIEQSAGETVSFYAKRLGRDLGAHPTIFVSYEPEQTGSFRGDTNPGAVMSLRFYGSSWTERQASGVETLDDFLNHETFHFWNAELARPSDGETRPWMHEGSANYAALLLSRERGTMTEERFLTTLNEHFERCQTALADRDLLDHGPKAGGDTYACGTLLQWAIDIGLRKGSNEKREFFSWWKDILAKAGAESGTYSFEGAFSLVPPEANHAADLLLHPGDAKRWAAFADAVHAYGAEIVPGRLAKRDLNDALDHLLVEQCGPNRGFFSFPDHLELDTGTHCGPLDGNPQVDSVAGFNPMTQSSAMNDKVRKICASKGLVEFGWKGKVIARAPCTKILPPATSGWQIKQAGTHVSTGH